MFVLKTMENLGKEWHGRVFSTPEIRSMRRANENLFQETYHP